MRSLLLFALLGILVRGQSLDTAVRQVARNVLARGEVAHVTEDALAPEFAAETTRARVLLNRVLARPAVRDARVVEVVVTATEDVKGPLLVVQIQKGEERTVKTAAYSIQPPAATLRPALLARLLWQQSDPILDLAIDGDRMLVLSPAQVEAYRRAADGTWEAVDAVPLEGLAPSRDPRGKLMVDGDTATAYLPGGTCTGGRTSPLEWTCRSTPSEFALDGQQVSFMAGENTMETADNESIFSVAQTPDFVATALADGGVRMSAGQQTAEIADWGSDLASLVSRCQPSPLVLATSSTADESLTAYQAAIPAPRRITDPLPLKGPVTALWTAPGGVLAVVHEAAPGRYAAYLVSLDCRN